MSRSFYKIARHYPLPTCSPEQVQKNIETHSWDTHDFTDCAEYDPSWSPVVWCTKCGWLRYTNSGLYDSAQSMWPCGECPDSIPFDEYLKSEGRWDRPDRLRREQDQPGANRSAGRVTGVTSGGQLYREEAGMADLLRSLPDHQQDPAGSRRGDRDVDLVADLERLTRLLESGALTPAEFAKAKQRILGG